MAKRARRWLVVLGAVLAVSPGCAWIGGQSGDEGVKGRGGPRGDEDAGACADGGMTTDERDAGCADGGGAQDNGEPK